MKRTIYLPAVLKNLMMGVAVMATTSMVLTSCNEQNAADLDLSQQEEISAGSNGAVLSNKYIVVLKDGEGAGAPGASYNEKVKAVKARVSAMLAEKGINANVVEHAYGNAIKGFSATLTRAEVNSLRNDSRVAYIEADRVITLAPKSNDVQATSTQEIPYGIARVGYASGAGKTAWVIDTGIDLTHPDLNVDVARSITVFTTGRDAADANDNNGHGTHVAGTIAAKNNTIGVIGVAYDATTVAVKVLDSRGSGSYSGVIKGVDYVAATAKPGDVANMSLGGPVSQALDDAVLAASNKGIYFALAAGNDSKDANTASPARVNGQYIYTVSAMNSTDTWASFSNFGNPPIDYCAPGVSIKSTWKGGGYNTISGTSMATPHVAGVLLITNGAPKTSGFVKGDPDGTADPIAAIQ